MIVPAHEITRAAKYLIAHHPLTRRTTGLAELRKDVERNPGWIDKYALGVGSRVRAVLRRSDAKWTADVPTLNENWSRVLVKALSTLYGTPIKPAREVAKDVTLEYVTLLGNMQVAAIILSTGGAIHGSVTLRLPPAILRQTKAAKKQNKRKLQPLEIMRDQNMGSTLDVAQRAMTRFLLQLGCKKLGKWRQQ
jgi:hypothetical protein